MLHKYCTCVQNWAIQLLKVIFLQCLVIGIENKDWEKNPKVFSFAIKCKTM